jgi:ABC-type transporter Mla subunit MlaD
MDAISEEINSFSKENNSKMDAISEEINSFSKENNSKMDAISEEINSLNKVITIIVTAFVVMNGMKNLPELVGLLK